MKLHRIKGSFLRYFYLAPRIDQACDQFYWPLIDIMIWGITAYWMGKLGSLKEASSAIMTALVFWQIMWRGSFDIACNLLQDFWTRNLINLFTSPLKKKEWIISLMSLTVVKVLVTVIFSSGVIYMLFGVNVFQIGWAFIPLVLLVLIFGWAIGFLTAGLLIYLGQKFQMLAWAMAYLFSPFCAIFYPQAVLPVWAIFVSKWIGITWVFETIRTLLANQPIDYSDFARSFSLIILYFVLSLIFFVRMFEKSRTKGLMRLE